MNPEESLKVLNLLLAATKRGDINWSEEETGYFSTKVNKREIWFRFIYLEASNQPGADRYIIQFSMPGYNDCFACGTASYYVVNEILSANSEGRNLPDITFAEKFLKDAFPNR